MPLEHTAPMTRITALIADDEEAPRAQLRAALQAAWPGLRDRGRGHNGVDAWDAWLEHEPEVCFLDIRMPGLSGIDVARRIGGRTPVVFVTAYGDHALAAFDAGAVDYVMKPVEPARLAQALRARARPSAAGGRARCPPRRPACRPLLEQLAGQLRRPPPLDCIQAGVGKEVRLIRVDDVVYFETDARYTRVVYAVDGADGEALIRTPLKELLAQLDEQRSSGRCTARSSSTTARGQRRARGRRPHAPDAARPARDAAGVASLPGPVQGAVSERRRTAARVASAAPARLPSRRHARHSRPPLRPVLPPRRTDPAAAGLRRRACPRLVSLRIARQELRGPRHLAADAHQPATGADTDKPAFWVDGNIHAAELTASTACLYWLHQLVTGYDSDAARSASCSTPASSTWCRA